MTAPVAVVTGGTRGIGAAITARLLADGWRVLATFVDDTDGAGAFAARHTGLVVRRADVTDTRACEAAVGEAVDRFGGLDHLVNNAAIMRDARLRDMTDDDWDTVVDTNLSGPFRAIRAALAPIEASDRGRIVSISSVAALMGNAWQSNYAAAKAGLLGLTRSLAREVAPSGTTVNLVVAGPTDRTAMTEQTPPDIVDGILRAVPLRRLIRPEEVAHAVRFLVDDLAAAITGSTVVVDGGLSM